jgi:cbb3-type cytochrome oxidase cytochrome c subunit
MKGLIPLLLGIFGTFAFSWVGLTVIPNLQIGHLDPQMDEEGTDVYPAPKSGMTERGSHVFAANGCFYCHSRQLRPDYAASDIDRTRDLGPTPRPKWGERRSAPRDYIFDRPVLIGNMRMGPDLSNMGKAAPAEEENASPAPSASPAGPPAATASPAPAKSPAASPANPSASPAPAASPSPKPANSPATSTSPAAAAASPAASPSPAPSAPPAGAKPAPATQAASAASSPPDAESKTDEPSPYSVAWHHRHLYSPRSISIDSNMPAYRFLYEKRRIAGERSADALQLTGSDAPPAGWEIIPTYDANCLVAYLMSLDQSHPLKEVKGVAPAASPAPAAPGAPAVAPAPSPAASPAKGGQ